QDGGEDETGLNSLAEPDVVYHKPTRWPGFKHALTDPELVGKEGDSRAGEDAPRIVNRLNAIAHDPRDDVDSGVERCGRRTFPNSFDQLQLAWEALLDAVLESDKDAFPVVHSDSAPSKGGMLHDRVLFE